MKFNLYLSIALLLLISGCTIGPKTQPIVVDETEPEEPEIIDVTGAITKEIVENDTAEINETEETTKTIIIEDLKFKPNKITIPAGTTVIWDHQDKYIDREDLVHMVMVYPIAKRSERMFYGDTFEVTFNEPGEYYYIDVIFKESMRGDIIVE